MRLDGFGIFVKDMGTMVRFYRDVLGFEIQEDENASNVYLEKDGTLFLLFRRSDFEKMTGRSFSYADKINGHYEIALSVKDYAAVDRAYKEVIEKGAANLLCCRSGREPDRDRFFRERRWQRWHLTTKKSIRNSICRKTRPAS